MALRTDDFAILLFDASPEALDLAAAIFQPLLTAALRDDESHKVTNASFSAGLCLEGGGVESLCPEGEYFFFIVS